MNQKSYKIGLFDDHPLITDGLNLLLKQDNRFDIQMIANTKEDLLNQLPKYDLDVLIMDVVVPNVNGLELFKLLGQDFSSIKLIAYTTLTSTILIENLLLNGVKAYINKRQASKEILEAIIDVCENKYYVPEQYEFLLKKESPKENALNLSPRELEVLALILEGKLSKEIADVLFISKNTVENHRTSLFKKFDVKNLAELFKQATRLGFLKD